jgi:hypothetical protein
MAHTARFQTFHLGRSCRNHLAPLLPPRALLSRSELVPAVGRGGTCDPDYVKKGKKDTIHYFLEDKIEHLLDAGTKKRVADWYPDDGNASHALAWCLPIGEYFGYVLCLTLVPVDGFGANHYQRIGLAVWSSGDWKASCASRISILQGMPDQAPPHRYFVGASDDGTELVRTIYIV